ncbi:SpoIIE family protein phosphatase [Lipingzhangella sp. LS1_29]|uniref:SpoIIE family protein phosphatase n=1 Tax=Lipingzhangella rawalii TaxID=2055835 RepID=A0ABU2H5R8_9ACTN|nr:SpoIIE family protein phosphatase [Lipingzhangella rawalii]MDS1270170.1 SpoIIE family protein phosphatase [Lipingzhangella rawalii]
MNRWGNACYEDSPAHAQSILTSAQLGVLVVDRQGHLRYWNPYAVRLFGMVDGAGQIGRSLPELGIRDEDSVYQLLRRALSGSVWEGTLAMVRPDATRFHLRVRAAPMCTDLGGIDGAIVVVDEALRTERSEEQLGLLDQIGDRLASSLQVESTLRVVAEILVPQFADHCFIDLVDRDRLVRRVSVHAQGWTPPPDSWLDVGEEVRYPEHHFVSRAMRKQESVVVGTEIRAPEVAPNPESAAVSERVGITSAIAAPLRARGELLGVVTLALSSLTDRDKTRYDGFDRDLVGAIASRVALAIDNARLYEEERTTALAFQHNLLPRTFPPFDGLSIAHRYIPTKPLETNGRGIRTQVGGDFYDVIPLSAGRVGIVIGDVEGRGAQAAAVMGQVRAAIRAFAQADREPADIMRELDEWVRRMARAEGASDGYAPGVSCLYLAYDAWSRDLTYANAGHPSPLLIVGDQVEELPLQVTDMLLGKRARGVPHDETVYRQDSLTLPPGATLLLYTDGLVERCPIGGELDVQRSLEQLRDRVREVSGATVEEIAACAQDAVPGDSDDDTALLVVRTHPEELALREQWFVAEPPTVADARHLAARTLSDWGMDPGQQELACLLISEVVTNVVLHAAPSPVRRQLGQGGGATDPGAAESTESAPHEPAPTDTSVAPEGADGLIDDEFSEDWSDLLEEVGAAPAPAEEPKREFLLRLRRGANSVWAEVYDSDLRLPRIRSATADDEGGRGLYLVDQFATRWGSRPTPDGKFVWFEVPLHGTGVPD